MTDHLTQSIQIHDWSLEPYQALICILRLKWSVMYLYTTVQVISHVFVYYCSSDQSCICIVRFKWSVMYLYTTVQVISHVFVYYGSSDQSCICILRFKWSVMYFVCYVVSPLSLPLIFLLDFELFSTVWYFSIIFWTIWTVWYFNFCFSFDQLLCLVYMYCIMIYFSHNIPLSLWKQLVLIKNKYLMDVDSIF
jgi:hypothetical protein